MFLLSRGCVCEMEDTIRLMHMLFYRLGVNSVFDVTISQLQLSRGVWVCPAHRWLVRGLLTSPSYFKNNRPAGHFKITPRGDFPLTYEQAQPPYRIGVTKGWNSWNASMC